MAGLYIHIPFCESRCIYCGFYSTTSLKLRDEYVNALCKEMQLRPIQKELGEDLGNNQVIETIYLGGGTPSQLSGKQLEKIFEAIQKNYLSNIIFHREFQADSSKLTENEIYKGLEITMECNPDDVTTDFCETLKHLPVNRISMGAQTFADERLHFLHRRHNAEEVRIAVRRLRETGINNISIDLMFGFPGETLDDWKYDIQEALKLNVEHISAYSLMYEEGTTLYRMLEQGKIKEIDEELSLRMYETMIDMLTSAGFEHYEISNFARPGFQSKHNSSYWHEIPYIGLGAAAHSYKRIISRDEAKENKLQNSQPPQLSVTRSWNVDNIHDYIQDIYLGKLPSEGENLNLNTRFNDLITTALRTNEGINLKKTKKEFGEELTNQLLQNAQSKIENGLMEMREENSSLSLRLTRKGIYISDAIMEDFIIVE